MVFKLAYFVKFKLGNQPAKFNAVDCLGQVLPRDLKKNNDDIISYCWNSKFPYFVKLDIGYQPAEFQISRLSGSNFIRGRGNTPSRLT